LFLFKQAYLSSYVGSENVSFQLLKSSGCRPNLREWWVGEKLALITMDGNGLLIAFGNKKKHEQFNLPHQGGKFEFGSLYGGPAQKKRTPLLAMKVWFSHQ